MDQIVRKALIAGARRNEWTVGEENVQASSMKVLQ